MKKMLLSILTGTAAGATTAAIMKTVTGCDTMAALGTGSVAGLTVGTATYKICGTIESRREINRIVAEQQASTEREWEEIERDFETKKDAIRKDYEDFSKKSEMEHNAKMDFIHKQHEDTMNEIHAASEERRRLMDEARRLALEGRFNESIQYTNAAAAYTSSKISEINTNSPAPEIQFFSTSDTQ